ncbi:MAG: biuret amidohydrolase [Gaiellaceae bacterium]|nr:biuret amidohydrolase [Gaiellaceae bacterium]
MIDVQKGELLGEEITGIPIMAGAAGRHARVRELVARAREAGIPVVFIQEVHKPSGVDFGRELDGAEGPHCVEGELATELADGLEPELDEYLIRKRRYSGFFGTELDLVLRSYGAETLVLVGALTDVCVHYTAVDAHQHDYRFRVVEDCVGGSSVEAHDASLRAMAYLQRDARVTSAEVLEAFSELAQPVA